MKQILAEIITIGDEILIGQIIDSNSAWMGEKLNTHGVKVHRISSISDSKEAICATLDKSIEEVDLILITGGLGPTKDDLTKHCLSEYFQMPLERDEATYQKLAQFFEAKNIPFNDLNKGQALLPSGCTILENALGTAQGMLFQKDGKLIISMPGVPYEMKYLMENEVLPKLTNYFELPAIFHRTILTVGVPESELAVRIQAWEEQLPKHIKLAYLPSYGRVRLRLSAFGNSITQIKEEVLAQEQKLLGYIEKEVFGYGNISLEEALGDMLSQHNKTIATAESCTGGNIASTLVSVSGSSNYFKGSIVAYHNSAKERLLGVKKDTLHSYGAVSEETVKQMAENVREKLGADIGVASSGIAGPNGGTKEKPVGTVWLAVSDGNTTVTKCLNLSSNRDVNIKRTTIHAMNMVRKHLKD